MQEAASFDQGGDGIKSAKALRKSSGGDESGDGIGKDGRGRWSLCGRDGVKRGVAMIYRKISILQDDAHGDFLFAKFALSQMAGEGENGRRFSLEKRFF